MKWTLCVTLRPLESFENLRELKFAYIDCKWWSKRESIWKIAGNASSNIGPQAGSRELTAPTAYNSHTHYAQDHSLARREILLNFGFTVTTS